jgi:two-component system CheB/CheR fusion protein
MAPEVDTPECVVAIGASAGGLEALERFFTKIPATSPLAFVVAQHLSPDHKSMMVELFGKRTALRVHEATDEAELRRGNLYLIPPRANVVVRGNRLKLSSRAGPHMVNLPIDELMRSLAESFGPRAIAVVLSGTGSDGREGVLSVKASGGTAFAQEPSTAAFDGMPKEAIRTGVVDAVLPPEELGAEVERVAAERVLLRELSPDEKSSRAFEHLVDEVRAATGFDLGEYKPNTILRRLERRLEARAVRSLESYVDVVHDDPEEARKLVADVLINVTSFFRDGAVFDALESQHLPELIRRAGPEPLRVWVPGCASGEEAYSLAMLLTEKGATYKIFGTDVDGEALARATAGVYPAEAVDALSPERRERFFVRHDGRYEVDRDLRKHVVFAPHDLLADPPFTRLNLISCRNVLIYLTTDAQRRVIDVLSFGLKPGGLLVLGTSEVLGARYDEFKPLDNHLKLFVRREGRRILPSPRGMSRQPPARAPEPEQATTAALRILIDRVAEAALLVDEDVRLVRVFGNAGRLLSFGVGEPSLDLAQLVPEPLRAVVLAAVHRAVSTQEEVSLRTPPGHSDVACIRAIPFTMRDASTRNVVVVLEKEHEQPRHETAAAPTEIATLERELLTARQSLQTAIEQLETSNEELQATNEELLASNEELQSVNEELQSVNEELHTVNVEHQARITELSETNSDLDNLLNATPVATIFLDEQLRIRRFNPPATALFPLVEGDRGRPLAHFTSSLVPPSTLIAQVKRVLDQASAIEEEVSTTSGQRFFLRAVPHVGPERRVCGVVLTLANVTALHESRESQELLQSVLDGLEPSVAVLDERGVIRFVNATWQRFADENGGSGAYVGASYLAACHDVPDIRTAIEAVLHGQRDHFEIEYPCHSPSEQRWFLMHVRRTRDARRTVVSHTNVTRTRREAS